MKQFEKYFLLTEIERLDIILLKNGIVQKKKRRDICEDYYFEFCNFLDEGQICVSGESAYVALSFPKKQTISSLHESIFSLISNYYERSETGATSDTNLPKQTSLAFWLILKPKKYSPINISIFEDTSDTMIISQIKQSIIGHLYFLGAVKSVNDKCIYDKIDTTIPLHKLHPSLLFSESMGIQINSQSKIIKRPDVDLKNISINNLADLAKELLHNKSFQPTRTARG